MATVKRELLNSARFWCAIAVIVAAMSAMMSTYLVFEVGQATDTAEVIARENRESSLEQCERGNETRPVTIEAYLTVARAAKQRAVQWQKIAPERKTEPVIHNAIKRMIEINHLEHRAAHSAARQVANAQRTVSVHPNSADLIKRQKVDCEATFGSDGSDD